MSKIRTIMDYKKDKAMNINEIDFIYNDNDRLVKSVSKSVESLYDEYGNITETHYKEQGIVTMNQYNDDNKIIHSFDFEVDKDGNRKPIPDSIVSYIYDDNYRYLKKIYGINLSTEEFIYDSEGKVIEYTRNVFAKETRRYMYNDKGICIKEELYINDIHETTFENFVVESDDSIVVETANNTEYTRFDKQKRQIYFEDNFSIVTTEYNEKGNKKKEVHMLKDFLNKKILI